MTDGWFVRAALMGLIGAAPVCVMRPFGLDPDLPGLVARSLKGTAQVGCNILLAAHGSASGRTGPEKSARDCVRRLADALFGSRVEVGFLERSPTLADGMTKTGGDALCLPFLAMDGHHMREDVRATLAAGGFARQVLPVISRFPAVDAMIARAIRNQLKSGDLPERLAAT
jgi:sirohydrochlorin ferrochelatase